MQQQVAALAQTAIEFPPMQAPASFNLDAVKAQVDEVIKEPRRAISRVRHSGRGIRRARCYRGRLCAVSTRA